MFTEFNGTTYSEWLEYHRKVTYPLLVKGMIDHYDKSMPGDRPLIINHIGKEKD